MLTPDNSKEIADKLVQQSTINSPTLSSDISGNPNWWSYYQHKNFSSEKRNDISRQKQFVQPDTSQNDEKNKEEFGVTKERYDGFLSALNNNYSWMDRPKQSVTGYSTQSQEKERTRDRGIDFSKKNESLVFDCSKYQFSQPVLNESRIDADLKFRHSLLNSNV